eukprot:12500919-Alexandrium_andersonii.AAC.1
MSDIRQTEATRHGRPTLWGDARRKAASAPPRARCRAACPMHGVCACVPHQEQQAQPQVQQ